MFLILYTDYFSIYFCILYNFVYSFVVFICFAYWWFTDMLPGLQQGQEKMSKSDPLSSIFMEDDEVGCM